MINRLLILSFTAIVFSSCEVMYRYFVTTSNRMGNTKIVVKLHSQYDLPKTHISYSQSSVDDYSSRPLPVTVDSAALTYQFILPAGSTVYLYPTKIGPPAIEYIVLNDSDTVNVPGSKRKFKSYYQFKKAGNQKFLLSIKPENMGDFE